MDHNAYGERHVRKKSFLLAIISAGVTALAMAAIVVVCVLNLRTCGSSYEKEINITTNLKAICNRAIKDNKGLDYKVSHLSCVKYDNNYLHVTSYVEELESVIDFAIEVDANDINTILDNVAKNNNYNVYSMLMYNVSTHSIEKSSGFIDLYGESYKGDSGEDDVKFIFNGIGYADTNYLVMYNMVTDYLDSIPTGYTPLVVSDQNSIYYNFLAYLYKTFK